MHDRRTACRPTPQDAGTETCCCHRPQHISPYLQPLQHSVLPARGADAHGSDVCARRHKARRRPTHAEPRALPARCRLCRLHASEMTLGFSSQT